jgi:hypothetical protein
LKSQRRARSTVLSIASGSRERRAHLLRRFDEQLVGAELPALGVGEGLARLDAEQRLVRLGVAGLEVVAVVGRDQRQAELARQRDQLAVGGTCSGRWLSCTST